MPTAPPTVPVLPAFPAVSNRTTYNAEAFACLNTLAADVAPAIGAAAANTYANAVEAAAASTDATAQAVASTAAKNAAEQAVIAATAVAGAAMWASGSYATGTVVWSPANGQNYRRKSPGGSSPTDPASDPANWYALTSLQALPVVRVTAGTAAEGGRHYLLAASLVLTLPAAPVVGDVIEFTNISGTQTCTVDPNGQKIRGDASVMLVDSLKATATLTFSGATDGWV